MLTDSPPTVLIVEDERPLADLYTAWLEGEYVVETAYSGADALALLGDHLDVVVLDRRMPGVSGDAVLEAIRDGGLDCKVAMATAIEPDFDILEMGFDDYVVKPIGRDELVATIDGLVRRRLYDEKLDEYASLVSKKALLEAEKPLHELDGNAEFTRLVDRIDALRGEVDPLVASFSDDDVAAVLRDLEAAVEA